LFKVCARQNFEEVPHDNVPKGKEKETELSVTFWTESMILAVSLRWGALSALL